MIRADGYKGEEIALSFLLEKGLKLRERNWRHHHLEVDLIMEDERYVHIVEVRTRTAPYLVSPAESVKKGKQRRLFRAASAYALKYNIRKEIVFDIVSIVYVAQGYEIEYLEGALLPLYI